MMRAPALLALALTAVASCRTPGHQASSSVYGTDVRNFEAELGMRPGVGFEGVLEDVRGICVDHNGISTSGGSQEATFNVHLIESHRELAAQMGISSASQIKSAVPDQNIQVAQKTKFVMGNTFSINRYAVFILVNAVVKNETSHLNDVTLKKDVAERLKQDPSTGLDKFRLQCGDAFLSGFTTGGEFHALIEIRSDSDEATEQLKNSYLANLSFGNGRGGTEAQIGAGLTEISRNKSVRIWTFQRGGSGDAEVGVVTMVDQVMERLRGLADSVKGSRNPRPLTATFSDYFTIASDLPASYRQQLLAAKDVIEDIAAAHHKLLDLQADLDFIQIHPEQFVGVDAKKLKDIAAAKREIDRLTKEAQIAAKRCAEQVSTCARPANLTVPDIGLPKRKPTLESLRNERLQVKTKLHYINANALADGWLNPPECYLEVSVAAKNTAALPVRRTETTYAPDRCRNLETNIEVPVALLTDAYKTLGVAPEDGWVQVTLWEDDPSWDDKLGSTSVWFKDLQNGAQLKSLTTDHLNMELGFEIKY